MKIVSWNCGGALRKKTEVIDKLKANILVIQECEDPERSTNAYKAWAGENYLWHGKNKNKGIGIFSKNGHSLQKLQWDGEYRPLANSNKHIWSSDKLESFLPCLIDGTIPLLGVWTKKNDSSCFGYVGQLWMFLQIHKDKLNAPNQIICGDFNSNSMWDKWDRWWNHSDVVEDLKNIHLESVYHTKSGESQGEELSPTFFMHRNKSKGYHIDYFFLRKEMLEDCSFQVLNQSHWFKSSDHLPLQLITPSHKISNGTL